MDDITGAIDSSEIDHQSVIAGTAIQCIGMDNVAAGIKVPGIPQWAVHCHVRRGRAGELPRLDHEVVVARTARQTVEAAAADQRVVALAPVEHITATSA